MVDAGYRFTLGNEGSFGGSFAGPTGLSGSGVANSRMMLSQQDMEEVKMQQ